MTKFWVTPLRSWYAVSNLLTQLSSSLQEAGVGNLRTKRLLVLASTSAVPCTRHLDSCCSKHSHPISHFLVHTHLSPPAVSAVHVRLPPPHLAAAHGSVQQLPTHPKVRNSRARSFTISYQGSSVSISHSCLYHKMTQFSDLCCEADIRSLAISGRL
jgi:hypothetical protein